MHYKKHLSFTALKKALSEHFGQMDDRRQHGKVRYILHDCLMSGFAMMFFQDPSILTFQQRLQDKIQKTDLGKHRLNRNAGSLVIQASQLLHNDLLDNHKWK